VANIEPIPSLPKHAGWQTDYGTWLQASQEAAGRPISFLNADIDWQEDKGHWQGRLQQIAAAAHANHFSFGIIYNASFPAGAKSDAEWIDRAAQNFTQIEERVGVGPDKPLFETWAYFPKRGSLTRPDWGRMSWSGNI